MSGCANEHDTKSDNELAKALVNELSKFDRRIKELEKVKYPWENEVIINLGKRLDKLEKRITMLEGNNIGMESLFEELKKRTEELERQHQLLLEVVQNNGIVQVVYEKTKEKTTGLSFQEAVEAMGKDKKVKRKKWKNKEYHIYNDDGLNEVVSRYAGTHRSRIEDFLETDWEIVSD